MLKLFPVSTESEGPDAKATDDKGGGPRVRLSSRYLSHCITVAPLPRTHQTVYNGCSWDTKICPQMVLLPEF